MIPLRDLIRSTTTPVINYCLIAANVGFFVYELTLNPFELQRLFFTLGVVPLKLTSAAGWELFTLQEQLLALAACMFLHGSWLHIIGNMWTLYIFGDNVEDRMGHGKYLLFYFAGGLASTAMHILTNWNSPVPVVGASGAIAAVMGAYLVYFPRARVITLIPLFFYFWIVNIPAYVFLAFWFGLQFFSGAFALFSGAAEGIAWWAHIGGFAFGALLARAFRKTRRAKPPLL